MKKIKVLFIGGSGRSGSTLLETILAQTHGFVSVGELNEIWNAGLLHNRLCGCGSTFLECDYWRSVIERSFGGIDHINQNNVIKLQKSVCRIRTIPRMATLKLQPQDFTKKLSDFCHVYSKLYEGIADVSGARVIVDSSKTPAHAFILSMIDNIELHTIQLVRDSRAVAYSWQRKKKIPGSRPQESYMVRINPTRSAIDWNTRHFMMRYLKKVRGSNLASYNVLRYEDFVCDPQLELRRLISNIGIEDTIQIPFNSDSSIPRLHTTHTIEGNPSKFHSGDISIRPDNEWKHAMSPKDRTIVSILTAPYLRIYGYI